MHRAPSLHRRRPSGFAGLILCLVVGCVYDPSVPDGALAPEADAARTSDAGGTKMPDASGAKMPDASVSTVPDADTAKGPDAGTAEAPDAGADAARDSVAVTSCRQRDGGPELVFVAFSTPYCIDATEVTNAQYDAFLAATKNGTETSGQSAVCSWNTSYVPATAGSPTPPLPKHPVVNVDWCDAKAFCKWAGKRLCGKIGGGTLFSTHQAADPTMGEWVRACEGADGRNYPYGPSHQPETCNTKAALEDPKYLEDVANRPACQGGYPGVFDLGGNVEEWVDACDADTGRDDLCTSAGPAAFTGDLPPDDYTCPNSLYGSPRAHPFKLRGFRCCADP